MGVARLGPGAEHCGGGSARNSSGDSTLTGTAANRWRIKKREDPGVDGQPSEAPELPKTLDDSLPRHSSPLGDLLLIDRSVHFHVLAEWASVTIGELNQAHTKAAERVHRAELDLTQRGVPKPCDDELQKLSCDTWMLSEEFDKVVRAYRVDFDGLEGDDGSGSRPAVDGTYLTQEASRVEDSQDHLTTPAPGTDLDSAGAQHESFAPLIAVAKDDRPPRVRLPPAAGFKALGLNFRQPAEEVAVSQTGRGHGRSNVEVVRM